MPLKFLTWRLDDSQSIFVEGRKKKSVSQIKHFTEMSVTQAGRGCNSHNCISDTWKKWITGIFVFSEIKYELSPRVLVRVELHVVVKSSCWNCTLSISCTCGAEFAENRGVPLYLFCNSTSSSLCKIIGCTGSSAILVKAILFNLQ